MKSVLFIAICFLSVLKVSSQTDIYKINSYTEGNENFEIEGKITYNPNKNNLKIFVKEKLSYNFRINHINRTRLILIKKNAFAPTHLAEWHKQKSSLELMDLTTRSTISFYLSDDFKNVVD